jgi:anti-sigma factor RsiW
MACAESPRVHALVDGELDPPATAALERHLEGCAECRALAADTRRLAAALRGSATRHVADPALRLRIRGALDAEAGSRRARPAPARGGWWRTPSLWGGAAGGALAAGITAIAIVTAIGRGAPEPLERDVVTAHLRALVSGHTIDVESSDRHTVKPWFAGHADVAPPVADFAADGFVLVGGRVDYVDGTRAAVVVYRHGAHLVDVFAWRDAPPHVRERATSGSGYRLLFWRSGDLAFCAVADTAEAELVTLRRLIKATLPADVRE